MSDRQLHVLFVLFFLAIAIFLTLGRVGTAFDSFALLNPDLGVYASFAAAQDDPGLFTNDPFLSDEKNTNSYNMVYIPLIKALKTVFGNYGTACAFLLPFFIFIHLLGYYVLGLSIFKNPWAGLFVALLISAPIQTYYDFWGLILDALPRFLYQAVLPFLMALAILRGSNPKWWIVIMAGVGLLNYIHPLSTPTWTIAFAFALWVSAPDVAFWSKVRMLGLAMVVLVVILLPFLMNYVGSTVTETNDVAHYAQTSAILQERFSAMSTNSLSEIFQKFFIGERGGAFDLTWYLVCILAWLGVIYVLLFHEIPGRYPYVRQISAWMAGIFVGSGVLPALEQAVFNYLGRIPPEFELSRTFRYMVPLMLLAVFSALWIARQELSKKNILSPTLARNFFLIISFLLLLAWGIRGAVQRTEFRKVARQNVLCWRQMQIVCPLPQDRMDFIGVLDAVREKTPRGARIFSEEQDVAIRYYALRPLVYTYKDGAPLAYTNQEQLLRWNDQYKIINKLAYVRKFPFRRKEFMNAILEFSKNAGAEYLILAEPYDPNSFYPKPLVFVYSNDNYSLYKITP